MADAYSFGILMQDLAAWYADPGMEKSPLALSFRDCVLAAEAEKDTPAWQADREYWLQRLPFLPAGPELPLARTPHPPLPSSHGDAGCRTLGPPQGNGARTGAHALRPAAGGLQPRPFPLDGATALLPHAHDLRPPVPA